MTNAAILKDDFRCGVAEVASLFTSHGFQRATQLEHDTQTTASVVYAGRNIAFIFTLDIRDRAVDLVVTKYRNGKLLTNWEGGYSSSLFEFLVYHCGYRGSLVSASNHSTTTASGIKQKTVALTNLLSLPSAANLLKDHQDALP